MSNYDHTIDDGLEDLLRAGNIGTHNGWDFNGAVFFAEGWFHEEVWQYRAYAGTVSAESLSDLMEAVNSRYGTD